MPTYHGKTLNAEFFRRGQNSRREYAFLRYVKCVFLPSSIKNIPEETFKGYDVLEDVNLENINRIGEKMHFGVASRLKDKENGYGKD